MVSVSYAFVVEKDLLRLMKVAEDSMKHFGYSKECQQLMMTNAGWELSAAKKQQVNQL